MEAVGDKDMREIKMRHTEVSCGKQDEGEEEEEASSPQ